MNKKIKKFGEAAWLLGTVLCALGVCFVTKGGFGVSMVVAPAYVIYAKVSEYLSFFTFGMSEYCIQGLLLIVLCIVIRKFKLKYLLSFFTAVIYGISIDIWRLIFGEQVCELMWQRILYSALGFIITALAIAFSLRTYLSQQVYELVVKELSVNFKWNINKVKWIYDVSSLAVGILLMLLLFGKFSFELIGIGTLVITLINSPLIYGCGKLLDKYVDFSSAFPRFYRWFNEKLD